MFPQQVVLVTHVTLGAQVTCWHVTLPQKGAPDGQTLPHLPQLNGSLVWFTHVPPQHMLPVMHCTLQTPPPVPAVPLVPAVPVTLPQTENVTSTSASAMSPFFMNRSKLVERIVHLQ